MVIVKKKSTKACLTVILSNTSFLFFRAASEWYGEWLTLNAAGGQKQ